MPKKAKSKAQAHFFGLIASGQMPRGKTSLTPAKAREMLKGTKIKKLPKYAKGRKK